MYRKNYVARILQSAAADSLPVKPQQEQQSKVPDVSLILEQFPTCQLKAELRRRRREGGLFRWILWKMEAWKLWEYF